MIIRAVFIVKAIFLAKQGQVITRLSLKSLEE